MNIKDKLIELAGLYRVSFTLYYYLCLLRYKPTNSEVQKKQKYLEAEVRRAMETIDLDGFLDNEYSFVDLPKLVLENQSHIEQMFYDLKATWSKLDAIPCILEDSPVKPDPNMPVFPVSSRRAFDNPLPGNLTRNVIGMLRSVCSGATVLEVGTPSLCYGKMLLDIQAYPSHYSCVMDTRDFTQDTDISYFKGKQIPSHIMWFPFEEMLPTAEQRLAGPEKEDPQFDVVVLGSVLHTKTFDQLNTYGDILNTIVKPKGTLLLFSIKDSPNPKALNLNLECQLKFGVFNALKNCETMAWIMSNYGWKLEAPHDAFGDDIEVRVLRK